MNIFKKIIIDYNNVKKKKPGYILLALILKKFP